MELTLAILKPHVIPNLFAHKFIKAKILEKGFKIVQSKTFRIDDSLAGDFYDEHRRKFFFGRLVSFMSSGPVEVLILAKKNAITEWREMLGPTKVYKCVVSHPESIRGMFGLTDTRNVGHGSGISNSTLIYLNQLIFLPFRFPRNIRQRDSVLLS